MRHLALALVALVVAATGAIAPAAASPASAAAGPRVAIIVGATHGATNSYRSYADQVYAEAVKYTSNVVKVYSPNATWTAAKAAVNGASIVVYLGHGNGWPSPYTYDPNYTTKNGFGLNATAGAGDSNTKYYGEPSIRTLTPAPNAVVLLFHLCYASGNSEPGQAAPTLSVARQRVDNYASAFLAAGARAVIADGHSHSPYYIRSLFTTRQTIDALWRGAPNFHGNVLSYPSSRSPGYTYQLDPDTPSGGYYRALTGKLDLRTEQVTGAGYAPTDAHPSAFVLPGAAEVSNAGGATLHPDAPSAIAAADAEAAGTSTTASSSSTTVAAGTGLRIDEQATAGDGTAIYHVSTLDGSQSGWIRAADLVPRDSAGPRLWEAIGDGSAFSPNGDGTRDSVALDLRLSESASWTLRLRDGSGAEIAGTSGSGTKATLAWDGRIGGAPAPDGAYAWTLHATDSWGNAPLDASGSVTADTAAPAIGALSLAADATPSFSPNGDGVRDTLSFTAGLGEAGRVDATIRDAANATIATLSAATSGGTATLTWNGARDAGGAAPDGVYTVTLRPRDAAGNVGDPVERTVRVYAALVGLKGSASQFYPQDGDTLARTVRLNYTLRSAATVRVTVLDRSGAVVRTLLPSTSLPAGAYARWWDGKLDGGAWAPRGTYRLRVEATDGIEGGGAEAQAVSVVADAFRITSSDTTPARGQRITITAYSAENLGANPRLTIRQPGRTSWSVTMTKVGTRTYRATITLRSGSKGTGRFVLKGTDTGGRSQSSTLSLPIH